MILNKLNPQPFFDVIILGAGINGCGIAHEFSRSGQRVLVIDKAAIGSGTSSKSSRLIHGGLRYLETLRFSLVHEALLDRQELLKTYPDLVKWRSFYLPVYQSSPRPAWMIWSGLKLYDLLVGKHLDHRSEIIPRKEFALHAPGLTPKGLKAVFHYYDAKTNDLDLTRRVAKEAHSRGALFLENTKVISINNNGHSFTVSIGQENMYSPILVNATGPWIDEVNELYRLPAHYHIRKISGIHIIVDRLLAQDLIFMQTRGKRIFFIIPEPEHNHTIIGTTEREETVTIDEVRIDDRDIQYLIDNINTYLIPEYRIQNQDIKSSYIGVRPLIAHKDNPTDLSREYQLDLHRIGNTKLIHVFGGKLTTYLSLSRKVKALLA